MATTSLETMSRLDATPITSFAHAARVEAADLEDVDTGVVTEQDHRILHDLEEAWTKFLLDNPTLLQRTGTSKQRVEELEQQLEAINTKRDQVEVEMQQQLDFIRRRKEDTESSYKKSMDRERAKQQKFDDMLQAQQDLVATSDQKVLRLLPWHCFLESLDRQTEHVGAFLGSRSQTNDRTIKPSDRAMYLVDESSDNKRDVELRAFRIDNALLRAQIKLTQQMIGSIEDHAKSLEPVGKFLTKNKVWDVMAEAEDEIERQ
eukprot:CAMPEP_0119565084 /NCGR_PEP_ID=MMETSP1352-20130426/28964_1 /TAXON_ID=265584 /ORGANISM="Stauroneis constricta, Strain CCMP1120" /LENGTH=260 /DNA_ID=CAMNT_0007613933 /DNA_START=98 /DNA_END=880 /DNA_ORIENTATION=+